MGEIAQDIYDGLTCQICGGWMEDVEKALDEDNHDIFLNPPGHPRTCKECKKEMKEGRKRKAKENKPIRQWKNGQKKRKRGKGKGKDKGKCLYL